MSFGDSTIGKVAKVYNVGVLKVSENDLQNILERLIIIQIFLTVIMALTYMIKRYYFVKKLVKY